MILLEKALNDLEIITEQRHNKEDFQQEELFKENLTLKDLLDNFKTALESKIKELAGLEECIG